MIPGSRRVRPAPAPRRPPAPANLAAALAPALDAPRPGSNSFAVAGALTGTGAGMLANDMHLGLRVPNIWFRARLRYPDPGAPNGERDVNGVTLPGTPAMVVGSNGQIAWGFTNSYGDWLDWVRVQRDPADPTRYKVPDGWATIERHDEHIQVKGAARHRAQGRGHALGSDHGQGCRRHAAGAGLDRATARAATTSTLMQLEHTPDVAARWISPRSWACRRRTCWSPTAPAISAGPSPATAFRCAPASIRCCRRTGRSPAPAGRAGPHAAQYPRIEDPADGRLWTANNRTVDGAGAGPARQRRPRPRRARAADPRRPARPSATSAPATCSTSSWTTAPCCSRAGSACCSRRWPIPHDPGAADSCASSPAHWQGRAAVDSVDYRLVRAFRTEVSEAGAGTLRRAR